MSIVDNHQFFKYNKYRYFVKKLVTLIFFEFDLFKFFKNAISDPDVGINYISKI